VVLALNDFSAADKLRLKIDRGTGGHGQHCCQLEQPRHAIKAGIAELAQGSNLLSFSTRAGGGIYIWNWPKRLLLLSAPVS